MIFQQIGSWVATLEHKDNTACTIVRYMWEWVGISKTLSTLEADDFTKAAWWPKQDAAEQEINTQN